jgi:CheY-like chemotaxis protein
MTSSSDLPAILIVDDVPANLTALEVVLAGLNCIIDRAGSGEEALKKLLGNSYALVLLDVQMPRVDGYEVARYLRMSSTTRELPIIFLTAALGSEANILEGYDVGAVDYLLKPINREVLCGKVRIFLELFVSRRRLAEANAQLESKNREVLAVAEAEAEAAKSLREVNDALRAAYEQLRAVQEQFVEAAMLAPLGALFTRVGPSMSQSLIVACRRLGELEQDMSELTQAHSLAEPVITLLALQDGSARIDARKIVDLVLALQLLGLPGVRVTTHFPERDLLIPAPSSLACVLLNVVSNTLSWLGSRGTLSIRAEPSADELTIALIAARQGVANRERDNAAPVGFEPASSAASLGIATAIARQYYWKLDVSNDIPDSRCLTIRVPSR